MGIAIILIHTPVLFSTNNSKFHKVEKTKKKKLKLHQKNTIFELEDHLPHYNKN